MELVSPRLLGVREHVERSRMLLDLARSQGRPDATFRLLMAALYSSRAVVEVMLEAAERGEIPAHAGPDAKTNRAAFEAQIAPSIPFYDLIERIRIHDFHRFGIAPPNPVLMETILYGPVKLTAQRGVAAVTASTSGMQVIEIGSSKVKKERPILIQDGRFFDEVSSRWVDLIELVEAFLRKADEIMAAFQGALTQENG